MSHYAGAQGLASMHPGQCQMGSPSRIGEVQAGRGRSDLDGPLGKATHRRILVELACWSSECGHCPRPPFPTPVASRAALVVPLRHGLFVGKQNRSTTAGTGCEMTATHRITDLSHASAGAHGGQGKTSRTGDAARGDQKQVVNPTKKKTVMYNVHTSFADSARQCYTRGANKTRNEIPQRSHPPGT